MDFYKPLVAICAVSFATITVAQDFDIQSFEDAVNEAIDDMPGVSFEASNDTTVFADRAAIQVNWANIAEDAPDFGFVVYDTEGLPVDVLSGDAPFRTTDNFVEITGYDLPEGYTIGTVGTAGYIEAASSIAQRVEAPSNDVEDAVQTVKGASAYITQELCNAIGRPTEITLNLTAGFKLAFSVETGSKFHWDLEVVCTR